MPHRVQPPGRINRVCGAAGGEGALAVLSNSHTKNSCSVWLPRQNITSPAAAHPEVSWSLMPLTRERRGLCVSVGNSVWKAFGGIYVFWMFRLTLIKQMSHVYAVWLDPKALIAGEHSEWNIIAQSGACNVMHAASSRLRAKCTIFSCCFAVSEEAATSRISAESQWNVRAGVGASAKHVMQGLFTQFVPRLL